MLTFPAAWLLLVSLSIVTLLRLRSPELLMKTSPDWVFSVSTDWVFPVSTAPLLSSTCLFSPEGVCIVTVTCSLVIIDEYFI